MRQRTIWLSSFGAGVAAAFLFDPATGRRRRHRVADAATHLMHRAGDAASTVRRDLSNRARGVSAIVRRRLAAEQPDDSVIEQRVHSALGRVVSHAHAITVRVDHGHVILDGPLPSSEEHRVLYAVRAVPGVTDVESRFDPHIQPAHEPSSEAARPHARTPARPAIDVQKAITVDLPVDRVFAFWDNPANLPTVMHHVREVRTTKEPGQWHWTVSGATDVPIEFVTVLTD